MPRGFDTLTRLACRKMGCVLPAQMRENGSAVAQAVDPLNSRPLGSRP